MLILSEVSNSEEWYSDIFRGTFQARQ